jgi:hypothetical protein
MVMPVPRNAPRAAAALLERSILRSAPARWLSALPIPVIIAVTAGWGAAPARAEWRLGATTRASIAFNNGIAFDPVRSEFFFAGASSLTNSGLYRTSSKLVLTAASLAVIPSTNEGYNHIGDLSFDQVRRRLLLPLECYYRGSGGNTCGVGAIGVADPVSLRFLYYVNLSAAQIKKAMWAEISPDGRWIWTSSGTHLLAYRAADVTRRTADQQRAGAAGGIVAQDLCAVLPTSAVTGASFYEDALTPAPRLLLALNRGTFSQVVSYAIGSAADGSARLLSKAPTSEIIVARSSSNNESEGLATTGGSETVNPLGGTLHWLMLPSITQSSFYSQVLSYLAFPPPPRDGASVPPGQGLQPALTRGLRLTVICNQRCSSTAVAMIDAKLGQSLGLASRGVTAQGYVVGTGSLGEGHGIRALMITFRSSARTALRCLRELTLAINVGSIDTYSEQRSIHNLSTTLSGIDLCQAPTQPTGGLG